MRSLMLAASVCLMALNFAGCSCTVNHCDGVSAGSAFSGGCSDCTTCDTGCDSGCDAGCDTCGGRQLFNGRLRARLSDMGGACDCGGTMTDCGCDDCGCGTAPAPAMTESCGCGATECDGGCGRLGRLQLGQRLMARSAACEATGCDGGCGGACDEVMQAGFNQGLLGRMGQGVGCGVAGCGLGGKLCDRCGGGLMHGKKAGCGRFGCGFGGRFCGKCRGLATGGSIPHRQPQPSGAGQAPSYAYPYYTTRAPRDFLMPNPPTIGY